MDKAKLIKLLRMTTSPHDGEALNAIRMVNTMLETERLDWDQVVNGVALPPPSMERQRPSLDKLGTTPNKFAGFCYCCGSHVAAYYGFIFKPIRHCPIAPSNWAITCDSCNDTTTHVRANPAPRCY